MKFRNVLSVALALTAINGGILIYQHFNKPPTPPSGAPASTTSTPTGIPPVTPTAPAEGTPAEKTAPPESQTTKKPLPAKTPPDQVATLELKPPPRKPLALDLPPKGIADWVLVEKKARRLTLFFNKKPLKSYDIALGQQPNGPKRFQGDNKTPEGRYKIDARKKNSDYHRALHISYPSAQDAAFAAKEKRSAGGDIMIHGLPNGMDSLGRLHLLRDWTAGCIAVTNTEIEELWRAIPNGTPIEIRP